MSEALVVVTFLGAVVVLTVLGRRLRVPYPIAFVIGGVLLSFSKRLPHPRFDPEIVLLLVLPPLLYSAAWSTDWTMLRRNWRPVSLLAIGLVAFTTVVVGVAVHAFVPGFGWPLAFTLGAIVSPPDAVAAEAIFERLAIPRRVAAIITGECLLNDATALVLYRFALAAAVTGTFSFLGAGAQFLLVAIGGIVIGIVVALAIEGGIRFISRQRLDDPMLMSVIFLLAPFAAYLPADAAGVSGVLAAVTAGMMLGRRSMYFIDSESRLLGSSVWRLLTFILNAFAFLLIGLQLPLIVGELQPHVAEFALYGLALAGLVIAVRILWVFPATYVTWLFDASVRKTEPAPAWQSVTVVAWAGMRGIVSLAAALALPYTLGERVFPQRGITIFFTFCVTLVTLVLQGATLGPLVEWLGVTETSKRLARETKLRIRALESGVEELHRLQEDTRNDPERVETIGRLLGEYEARIDLLRGRTAARARDEASDARDDRKLERAALDAERRAIMEMRNAGEIPDDVFRSIEYDLDLAALRLT